MGCIEASLGPKRGPLWYPFMPLPIGVLVPLLFLPTHHQVHVSNVEDSMMSHLMAFYHITILRTGGVLWRSVMHNTIHNITLSKALH